MIHIIKKFSTALLIVGMIVVISSCKSNVNNSSNDSLSVDSLPIDSISAQVKNVVYPLPTPFEMSEMLNKIGAVYVPKALNKVENVDKYFTEKSKAVNLGIYGADIAYTVTYNKNQDTKQYLKAIKKLMDDMGIKIDYRYMISEEFKQKLSNKDTVVKVVTNTFYNTYTYLNKKNSPETAVLMVSGMWIELMYIATHISNDTYNNPEIVKIIYNQKDSYLKIMNLLENFNKNQDVSEIEKALMPLKPVFENIDKGLKTEEYNLIMKTIEDIRTSFVS